MESIFTVKLNFAWYQLMLVCFLGSIICIFFCSFIYFYFPVKVSNFLRFFLGFSFKIPEVRTIKCYMIHSWVLAGSGLVVGSFYPTFREQNITYTENYGGDRSSSQLATQPTNYITSTSFAPHLFLLGWVKLNLILLLDQLRRA